MVQNTVTVPPMSEENLEKLRARFPPGTRFIVWTPKGRLLTRGGTAMIELMSSGDILKRPRREGNIVHDEDNLRNMRIEAQIYEALGEHPRLAKYKGFDPEEHEILLENVPNGRLDQYLKTHKDISLEQRLRWTDQAIESLEYLHSSEVIHCDFGPHNLLLDQNLDLRITDFGGSSFKGSQPWVAGVYGYWLPDEDWKLATHRRDLFALGSTIYCIFTGHSPFEGLGREETDKKFRDAEFPDVAEIPCAEIVNDCWRQSVKSIYRVRQDFEAYLASRKAHHDLESGF